MTKVETKMNALKKSGAKVCAMLNEGGYDDALLTAEKKVVNSALEAYNAACAEEAYTEWGSRPDSVKEALTALYVPKCKSISFRRDKDTGLYVMEIRDRKQKVNLLAMKACNGFGAEKFHSDDWEQAVQKFCFLLAGKLDEELGHNPDFENVIGEAAKAFEFAPDANPLSNKSVVKALQYIVDGVLFVDNGKGQNSIKMTQRHWRYVRECLTGEGKDVCTVKFGGTTKMLEFISNLIHGELVGIGVKLVNG